MNVVVSPYHLTTREPAAMASLQLADRVVTLMPAPFRTMRADDLRDAAAALPRYRKFVESWQWTQPLWQSGAIVPDFNGADALDEVRRVWSDLLDGAWSELAPLMRAGLFDDEKEYLDAVAGDVLKGGPDPGICVPLSAGLDRFAVRHGLMVARSAALSVAQKAEEALGRRVFAFTLPVLVQASGELLADVRADSMEMLAELRDAINEASMIDPRIDSAGDRDIVADAGRRVTQAAKHVQEEMEELVQSAVEGCDRHDVRAIAGTATVTGVELPMNAVLTSSSRAAASLIGLRAGGELPAATVLPVADPLAGGRFVGLVIKLVGAQSARWR